MNVIVRNLRRGNMEGQLFELAKVYIPQELPLKSFPEERTYPFQRVYVLTCFQLSVRRYIRRLLSKPHKRRAFGYANHYGAVNAERNSQKFKTRQYGSFQLSVRRYIRRLLSVRTAEKCCVRVHIRKAL